MASPFSVFGVQLRPVLLWATGISAAAVTSCFLLYRWQRLLEQQRAEAGAVSQSDACDGMDHGQDSRPSVYVSIPEEVSLQDLQPLPFGWPSSCRPLASVWQFCRDVDRTTKVFASTCTKWSSDYRKLVEVKLQHKALYNGLESEHWWVLTNDFYHVLSLERPPQYFARVTAVACIKRTGSEVSEAQVYLRTESTDSSVQGVLLKTKVSITYKGFSMDADGRVRCHESDDAQTLETPAPVFSSKPRPPPGF